MVLSSIRYGKFRYNFEVDNRLSKIMVSIG